MIDRLEIFFRRLRRRISRSEWLIHLLGLSRSEGTADEPGLLMIQIDGLSRVQFERALAGGRLPFLRKLLKRQHYRLHTHYSGIPSSTPAVQGELFFGARTAVPAFSFLDRRRGRIFRMFDQEAAEEIEQRLAEQGEGLLAGGSAYSNIYTGGAAEAHFCGPTLGWGGMWRRGSPLALPLVFLLHINVAFRTLVLLVVELFLALVDCARGLIHGHDLWKEIKFIPARVGVCIFARELATIGAMTDAARGLPVIHLNLLGYDEQSHRRGPSSAFAHWSLKGIDGAVKRLWRAAHRSALRRYDVWVYSDHGQEDVVPFAKATGRRLVDAVMRIFDESVEVGRQHGDEGWGIQRQRIRQLGHRLPRRLQPETLPMPAAAEARHPIVTAMGPIGHVYWPVPLDEEQLAEVGRRLAREAAIPLVLAAVDGRVRAWTAEGDWSLPHDAPRLLGGDHPALEAATVDLMAVCRHESAGTFVVSGWRPDGAPISFPSENGAHGGPGRNETQGFALLPVDAPADAEGKPFLRPTDLRAAALATLGRLDALPRRRTSAVADSASNRGTIRIMTYNVHSCVGMDGRLSPRRIARVIARHDPDIVCLQELDVGRTRTGGHDQAHVIAQALEMNHHFHAALHVAEERYGDAVLSRLPMRLVRAEGLPAPPNGRSTEPRGALWVEIEIGGLRLNIVNTHLGIYPGERRRQARTLLGERWLGDPACRGATVLCGDFNALPRSVVHRMLRTRLHDAQLRLVDHRPRKTWFGRYPLGRIDHVFVSEELEVIRIRVASGDLVRAASDHLPLIVDLTPTPRRDP
jgi:endonuclease/exonuclease/phosphatase family metal-dependent hydrolase